MKDFVPLLNMTMILLYGIGMLVIGTKIIPECPDCICPSYNCPDCICQGQEKCTQIHINSEDSKYEFVNIAKAIAKANNYSLENYNCVNYTIDLVNELHKNNYEAHFISGDAFNLTDNATHAFTKLCLYIESTTGEILTSERFIEQKYTIFETDPEWTKRYLPVYY